MQMLYNSDSYVVVQFNVEEPVGDVVAVDALATATATTDAAVHETSVDRRSGYELVDKFARKGIFLQGALADSFKEGVDALIKSEPSAEQIDAYIARYASLMQQPVVLH